MELLPHIKLVRIETGEKGTFGAWIVNSEVFCSTLELPWKMNTTYISCIPEGQYIMKRVQSQKHGNTFRVQKVFQRSGINIHAATFARELEGCIALGESIRKLKDDRRALVNSGATFRKWLGIMKGHNEARLTVASFY